MKHLIQGHASDAHAQHMLAQLRERGHAAYLIETHRFPGQIQISLSPADGGGSLRLADGTVLALDEIGSVYWRNFCGVTGETTRANRGSVEDIAYYDSMACIRSWFQLPNQTRWFNSWRAFQSHQEKPHQLYLVEQAGVTIPRTYIGNDAQQILHFAVPNRKPFSIPCMVARVPKKITAKHLGPEHLAKALRQTPITLQQYPHLCHRPETIFGAA